MGNMDTRKREKKTFFVWVLGIAGLFIAFSLGCQILSIFSSSDRIPPDAKEDFHLMAEAWNAIHAHYVDQAAVKPTPLTYGAISGMVDALGDTGHSSFLSPQMIKEEEELTEGRYKGIGAEVMMKGGHVVIVTPMDGSPAQKAGLKPGDIVLEVNGQDTTGLNLLQVVKHIAGPEGTKVTLTILSPDTGLTKEITLVRAVITVDNVTWNRLPGTNVAHRRIGGFSERKRVAAKQHQRPDHAGSRREKRGILQHSHGGACERRNGQCGGNRGRGPPGPPAGPFGGDEDLRHRYGSEKVPPFGRVSAFTRR
jgi:carboxyl-terminal processing protease